jgi:hypothetical protein
LTGQSTAATVGNGTRNENGHIDTFFVKVLQSGINGGLCVQRIENGFDQNNMATSVNQTFDLGVVGGY